MKLNSAPVNNFTSMSTDASFQCSRCIKLFTPADEYATRQIGGSHGEEGGLLVHSPSCSVVKLTSRKRKRDETHHDHPSKRTPLDALAPRHSLGLDCPASPDGLPLNASQNLVCSTYDPSVT